MAKTEIEIIIKFSLWGAIKLRIAGIWNVIKKNRANELMEVNVKDTGGMVTAPLPTEPRPRSKDPPRSFLVKEPEDYVNLFGESKRCPVCEQFMAQVFEGSK